MTTVNEESFHKLLDWIDDGGDSQGEAYEKLRIRLIKIFTVRGCLTPEELTDETFERVTVKIDTLVGNYEGDPRLYFYGVAKNVFREHLRKPAKAELPVHLSQESANSEKLETHDRCLTKCMDNLFENERDFILEYYRGERSEKIENRQRLMESLDLTPQAIRVRAFRIRSKLQKCVLKCVETVDV